MDAPKTAQALYQSLASPRDASLMRGRECARLTIPSLLPEEGSTGSTEFVQPYQSVGARGVNNLSSKILLALFPPGTSFFRLKILGDTLDEIMQQGQDVVTEFEQALSRVERTVMDYFDSSNARAILFEFIRQLVAVGNCLIHIGDKSSLKLYRLDQYVVQRDLRGNLTTFVCAEGVSPDTLTGPAREVYETHAPKDRDHNEDVTVYTAGFFEDGRWRVWQELFEYEIAGTRSIYPKNRLPYLAQRWLALPGEDYGRSHAEEYIGDLRSYEALSRSIVEFAAAVSKILFLVAPGGVTQKRTIERAPSGAIVDGQLDDIGVLPVEKFADFQVAQTGAANTEKRLEQAFLLNTSVQRQAERVTAEEIRFVAGELEQALGGV